MAQSNWSAEDPLANAQRKSERADRQAAAKAQDRRAAVRAAGRNRRSI